MIDLNKQDFWEKCIESLYFGYRAFTAQADEILAQRGLNRVHHRILYFIGRNPGIGVGELLAILQVSKQALNVPLRQLLEMKLVGDSPGKQDRRTRHLTLTPKGKKLEAQLTAVQIQLLENAMASASAGDKQKWLAIMQTLGVQ